MQLPITRPSRMSYADELNFSELLGELKSNRFYGFIRVTSGPSEGYILFKEGKQIAASYDDYSKMEAIKNIKAAIDDSKTLIEVFEIRESQIKYFMDINKHHLISSDSKFDVLDELQKSKSDIEEEILPTTSKPSRSEMENIPENESEPPKVSQEVKEPEIIEKVEVKEPVVEDVKKEPNETEMAEKPVERVQEKPKTKTESSNTSDEVKSEKVPEPEIKPDIKEETAAEDVKEPESIEELELMEASIEAETADRADLMEKYGLKDVGAEEVDTILETYKGGSLSDEDVEKIELTLMNKIKKSILGIPRIKGTEVMVFLENNSELTGNINIITEYESKGFLSRIVGDSKGLEKLRNQIINITQIEIKKSFRGYPEIVDDFEINVEIS